MNMLEKLAARQHLAVAFLSTWLIVTSPWIAMLRQVPRDAGLLDYGHVVLGFVTLLIAITYTIACTRAGRWRLYFPWQAGQFGAVGRDLGGLLRGRVPAAEGGGLFGLIEGLLLVLLVATATTGAIWFATQGTADALAWRSQHIFAARGLVGCLVLHVITVSLHLIDFVRD
jgi:Prokaryotic cytochrome b561